MSAFVDPEKTFNITVYWKQDGDKVDVAPAPEPVKTSGDPNVKTEAKPAENLESYENLTIGFRYPDYAITRRIVAESTTVQPSTGEPILNIATVRDLLLFHLAKSWDAKDAEGKPIECTGAQIVRLHSTIAKAFIDRLYFHVAGDTGLF